MPAVEKDGYEELMKKILKNNSEIFLHCELDLFTSQV